MRRPGSKALCAYIVLVFLLVSVLGAVLAPSNPSHGVVRMVAAQTPPTSNVTVNNSVSVLSESVSFGSTLHVEGTVTTPQGPLASTPVTLHMGDITLARTQTDVRGRYAFSAPVSLNNYVPAVFSGGASIYTVVEPANPAIADTPSVAVSLPVNTTPAYGVIAAVTGVVVLLLLVYARFGTGGSVTIRSRLAAPRQRLSSWTSRRALRENEQTEPAPPEATPEQAPSADRSASQVTTSAEELPEQAPVAEHAPAVGAATLAGEERTEPAPSVDRSASRVPESAEELPQQAPVAEHAPAVGDIEGVTKEGTEEAPSVDREPLSATEPAEELPVQAPVAEKATKLSLAGAMRSIRRRKAEPVYVQEQPVDDTTLAAAEQETEAPPQPAPVPETELALETARDLFDQGKTQPAVGVLYAATVTCLARSHGVTLKPSMTHGETFEALQKEAPDVVEPLRTLTEAYERTAYAGKSLSKEQQNTAIEACKSICKYIGREDSL